MSADPVTKILEVVKPVEEVDVAGDHLNAERFLTEHLHEVRFSPEMGKYFVWNSAWWEEDRLERVQQLAKETIDGLRSWVGEATSESDFKRRAKHYSESARSGRRDGLLAIARTDPSVVVRVEDLDRQAHLLACRNGTVDLRTGELLLPEPRQLITRGVDVDYDPLATSEVWDEFLKVIFNFNLETITYVKTLLGYCITGEVGEHLLPDWYGKGKNGKSALITAITNVVREHSAIAPDGLLVEQKNEQHPERLAMLRGRRLVVSMELENKAVLAEGLVKSITGGDRITARYMYGQRFDFEPTHTVILVTNHLPRVRGTDEAIWRRLRVVPFTVTIPEDQRIPDFGKLLAELHGQAILNWLVQGAVSYYRNGLHEADEVRQATFNYRQHEDVFAQFLEECTVVINGRTAIKDLLAVWRDWARANGTSIGRTQDFTDALESHGVDVDRGRTSFARHLGILTTKSSDQDECTSQHLSSDNFSHAHTREEVYGYEVLRGADATAPPLLEDDYIDALADEYEGER